MPKVLGSTNRVGNFLIREEWRDKNWCRDDVAVDLTGMPELALTIQGEAFAQVGTVVYEDADALGTYVLMDATYVPVTDKIGIIVDERLGDHTMYSIAYGQQVVNIEAGTTDVTELAILNKGKAMVRKDGMIFPVAQEANVLAGLADAGIEVITELQGFDAKDVEIPLRTI